MRIIRNLNELPKNKNFYIYGAGLGGKVLKSILLKKGFSVKGFIDDNKKGFIDSLPIVSIEKIKHNDIILIASAYWFIIENKLKNIKHKVEYFVVYPYIYYKFLFFNEREKIRIQKIINNILSIFDYEFDKKLFKKILNSRLDPIKIKEIQKFAKPESKQYIEYINPKFIRIIIEGGVFDGKDSLKFSNSFDNKIIIYGFEPLWDKIKKKYLLESKNFQLIKKALGYRNSKRFFNINYDNLQSSKFMNKGEIIEVISIDEFAEDNLLESVDFIKLDIEGAEFETLKGATNTIMRFRPQIAVAIYHSKWDIINIPIFLKKICKNYIFKIGHYSPVYWDTILYAIPKEKYER